MEWRQLLNISLRLNKADASLFPTPGATLRGARWIEQAIFSATFQIKQNQDNVSNR